MRAPTASATTSPIAIAARFHQAPVPGTATSANGIKASTTSGRVATAIAIITAPAIRQPHSDSSTTTNPAISIATMNGSNQNTTNTMNTGGNMTMATAVSAAARGTTTR